MPMVADFFRQIARPEIRSRRELAAFVARTAATCVLIALASDVLNQLVFFESWGVAVRSWVITTVIASVLATGASWAFGRVHLELHHAKAAVDELSRTDPLTGLPNRRAVFQVAEASASSAMALVIVDIDRFKRVNDSRGHLAGDEVIRMIAHLMVAELGSLGYVGRIGGEEFALVGSDNIAPDRLIATLESFRARVAATPIVVTGGAVVVTVSAGAALRAEGQTFTDLFADADRALYVAKQGGRNRIGYSPRLAALIGQPDQNEAMWRADPETGPKNDDVASVA